MILSFAKLSSAYSQIARTYVSLSSTALSIFAVACWFSQLNSTLTTQDPRGFCYLYVEPAHSVIYYLGSYFMKASQNTILLSQKVKTPALFPEIASFAQVKKTASALISAIGISLTNVRSSLYNRNYLCSISKTCLFGSMKQLYALS